MDELGRVIANLMNSLPENNAGGAEDTAPPVSGESLPGPSEEAVETAASLADGGGGMDFASLLPGIGGGNLMGMLGAMGGGAPPDNHKMQLLIALKPYLRPERCERVDRLCRLMDMAYGVRGALHSLGGILHV